MIFPCLNCVYTFHKYMVYVYDDETKIYSSSSIGSILTLKSKRFDLTEKIINKYLIFKIMQLFKDLECPYCGNFTKSPMPTYICVCGLRIMKHFFGNSKYYTYYYNYTCKSYEVYVSNSLDVMGYIGTIVFKRNSPDQILKIPSYVFDFTANRIEKLHTIK